jgi:hypothetical protein
MGYEVNLQDSLVRINTERMMMYQAPMYSHAARFKLRISAVTVAITFLACSRR